MKNYLTICCMAIVLMSCSGQEQTVKGAAKEVVNGMATGVENIVEGVKQTPDAIGDAARKVKQDTAD